MAAACLFGCLAVGAVACAPLVSRIQPADTEAAGLPTLRLDASEPPDPVRIARGEAIAGAPGTQWEAYAAGDPDAARAQPVVVFFHGFDTGAQARSSWPLIRWYAAGGVTVVWLRLCDPDALWCAPMVNDYAANAELAYADAWRALRADARGEPPPVAFVGYSIGTHAMALLASRLGRRAGKDGPPAPGALVCLDPAGHDFARDDSALGLTHEALDGIDEGTPLLMLRAQASADAGNGTAFGTSARLYHRIPVLEKAAFVIPHACVSRRGDRIVFSCPAEVGSCRDDYRCYLSEHESFTGAGRGAPHAVDLELVLRSLRFVRCVARRRNDCLRRVPRGSFAHWRGGGAAVKSAPPRPVHHRPAVP